MARFSGGGRKWSLDVDQQMSEVICEHPTPDEAWRYADDEGHEHYYDHGYPTLEYVVDEQHWCDGTEGIYNHDPHWAVDEAHHECKRCRQVIEPAMRPPYTSVTIPGPRSATLEGYRSDGAKVRAFLTEDEYEALKVRVRSDTVTDGAIQRLLDSIPDDRLLSVTFASR